MNNLSESINKLLPTPKERDVLECLSSNLDFCQNISLKLKKKYYAFYFKLKRLKGFLKRIFQGITKFYEIAIDCKIALPRMEESEGEAKC